MSLKMVIRADDVGYTDVNDLGAMEAIRHGMVTAVDVMLDCPGTERVLNWLRDFPWLSVGWHMHFWGSPVLSPEEVPSLVIPETGRFRHDLMSSMAVEEEEMVRECRAEMERCVRILGRPADTGGDGHNDLTPCRRAVRRVLEEYHIPYNYASRNDHFGHILADSEWLDRKVYMLDPDAAYEKLLTDSISELEENYDPVKYYTENRFHRERFDPDAVLIQAWHPGYLDYFNYRCGDHGPLARHYTLSRIIDSHALCSTELHDWIRENGVELVNIKDAIYGTREFQEHLRETGSDLAVGG